MIKDNTLPFGEYPEEQMAMFEGKEDELLEFGKAAIFGASTRIFANNRIEKIVNATGEVEKIKIQLREPFYTSSPLSSIKDLSVVLDGVKFTGNQISVAIRDQKIDLESAKTIHEIWWNFGETIDFILKVETPEQKKVLEKNSVKMNVKLLFRFTFGYGFPGDVLDIDLSKEMEVS